MTQTGAYHEFLCCMCRKEGSMPDRFQDAIDYQVRGQNYCTLCIGGIVCQVWHLGRENVILTAQKARYFTYPPSSRARSEPPHRRHSQQRWWSSDESPLHALHLPEVLGNSTRGRTLYSFALLTQRRKWIGFEQFMFHSNVLRMYFSAWVISASMYEESAQ
jgi:hypothetical protein